MTAKDKVCAEIQQIISDYREQQKSGFVDYPGGFEHMGDVWSRFMRWDRELREEDAG